MEQKLFMVLLGSKPPGRNVEQHDYFFGIGNSLTDLYPAIHAFWPKAGSIHIDAWREVTNVDGYQVIVAQRELHEPLHSEKLFFINLGGYQEGKFEEQHYTLLTVSNDKNIAQKSAKQTLFFKQNGFKGASSHIDDKYGIDVDDIYQINDILPGSQKEKFCILLKQVDDHMEDELHLGYLRISKS